jgi:NaMN:DMB phosphoribosyltransferase
LKKALKRVKEFDISRGDKRKVGKYFGDPVIYFISNFINNFNGNIILAGGTQMLAAYALSNQNKNVEIWTTRYVVEDRTATFKKTAQELGIKYEVSSLDLSKSKFQGLRDYENGIVKEGVGAGAFMILGEKMGISNNTLINSIDELYAKITSS